MKTNRLFFVIAVSFSFCVMGQMKIQNDGQISIGGYGSNSMGSSTLNLFPKNEKAPTRISFYNSVSNPVNDVYIGRYITSENPSLFHLYGREGFCFSSSEGDVVLYDNANYGSMIQFLNVDVIGYFYSPSDSRFKKNIQPLNTLGITPTLGNQLSVEQGNSCRNKQHKNKQKRKCPYPFRILGTRGKRGLSRISAYRFSRIHVCRLYRHDSPDC